MKTRTLAPIDYGLSGESSARYKTGMTSYKVYYNPPTVLDYEQSLRAEDSKYTNAYSSTWPMPSPSCTQSFDSTRRDRKLYPNDCTNIKNFYKSWYFTFGTNQIWNPNVNAYRANYYVHYRMPHKVTYLQPLNINVNIDSVVSSNLRAEAYWTMRPRFEGEVSMINALYELKDFKDILKVINPKNFYQMRPFLKNYDWVTQKSQSTASKATETIATLHLFDAFAAQPLIADVMQAIAQAQATVLEHQTAFGLVDENTRRFKRVIDPIQSLSGSKYSNYGYYDGFRDDTTFVANMIYSQRYRPQQARDAFVQYWGLNPFNIEAIWNALPFSFLIDYFMSIGKSFHLMRRDPNIDIVPKKYTESIFSRRQVGSFIGPGTLPTLGILTCTNKGLVYTKPSQFTDQKPIHVTGFESSYYRRLLTEPYKGPALPRIKVPSTKQGLNMLALLRVLL